jgi:transposase
MALIVGIDLARKGAHDAVIVRRETGLRIGRSFRFCSSPEGVDTLFGRIDAVRQKDESVDFVIDSPGRAWIPVAAVLMARDYCVYRPSANRVRRIRQAGHGKNKTNRIDALTLARCLMSFPEDTSKVFLPQGLAAQLDGLVRQRDRVVDSLRRRKQRIQDLCEAINPGLTKVPEGFLLTEAGRAFLRSYLDPRAVVRLGKSRFGAFLQKRHRLKLESETVEKVFNACREAVELYRGVREAGLMPFHEGALQEEMNWELDQLEREEERQGVLEVEIAKVNKALDPSDSFISLPGIAHVIGAGIRICVGDIDRFAGLSEHRGYVGLYPSVRGTGDRSASGTRISKMSCNRYKRYLYLAAQNACRWDLEMAAFYHKRRETGHTHKQAVCAVANGKLLPRIHKMLRELKEVEGKTIPRPHYVFRDLSGNPISKAEAKAMIQAKWGDVSYQ